MISSHPTKKLCRVAVEQIAPAGKFKYLKLAPFSTPPEESLSAVNFSLAVSPSVDKTDDHVIIDRSDIDEQNIDSMVGRSISNRSTSTAALWRPFFGINRFGSEFGKRFFARFTGSKTMVTQSAVESTDAPWRQSQSEDTHNMDKKIVQLLSSEAASLPKPCDPLTYCFWQHGMRRRFESVSANRPSENALMFTVCSYNVLCQRTLGYYIEKLYSHCPFEYLTWQRRWPLLAVELQMLDADVFCLQEVQADHFDQYYLPLLSSLGYDGVFKKKLKKRSDGCATFWRRDKFKPRLIHPLEYSLPAPHEHSDSVAVIVVLEPTSSQSGRTNPLIVANTHLMYQPACGATKLCQAAMLLAHLQKITSKFQSRDAGQSTPVILCGDFNSIPDSPLYSLIVRGQLQYRGLTSWSISGQKQYSGEATRNHQLHSMGHAVLGASLMPHGTECSDLCTVTEGGCHKAQDEGRLRHGLDLRSVYDHLTETGEREVTTFLRDQPMTVDYIFYNVNDKSRTDGNADRCQGPTAVRQGGLQCVERYRLPDPDRLDRTIGYLPNQYCASDHLPLMAKFALE